jgi:hypothetical protein
MVAWEPGGATLRATRLCVRESMDGLEKLDKRQSIIRPPDAQADAGA